jgi:hypothetical protein
LKEQNWLFRKPELHAPPSVYIEANGGDGILFVQMPPAVEELLRRAESLKQEGNELHINKEYAAGLEAAYISSLKPLHL